MLADVDSIANVFRALAYAIVALAVLTLCAGISWAIIHQRRFSAKVDSKLGAIDLAVNGVAPDEPRLIDKVRRIESTLDRICTHLAIPTHTEEHQ